MGSCGWLWDIPSRKKRVLFTINSLWACLHLPRGTSPPSWKQYASAGSSPAQQTLLTLLEGHTVFFPGYFCTVCTIPSFFTMNVTLLRFRISGQKGARIDSKRICNYFQGWQGPYKLPSRSSAFSTLAAHPAATSSWFCYKHLCPLRWMTFPSTGIHWSCAWYFSGLVEDKGTSIRDDPEQRTYWTQPRLGRSEGDKFPPCWSNCLNIRWKPISLECACQEEGCCRYVFWCCWTRNIQNS